jgi:hypothetical protein
MAATLAVLPLLVTLRMAAGGRGADHPMGME